MEKVTGNEPMMPVVVPGFVYGDGSSEPPSVKGGLTIRQYYAGLAMQSLIADRTTISFVDKVRVFFGRKPQKPIVNLPSPANAATFSLRYADALIAELNKPKP